MQREPFDMRRIPILDSADVGIFTEKGFRGPMDFLPRGFVSYFELIPLQLKKFTVEPLLNSSSLFFPVLLEFLKDKNVQDRDYDASESGPYLTLRPEDRKNRQRYGKDNGKNHLDSSKIFNM
jgi:hypothetical protein